MKDSKYYRAAGYYRRHSNADTIRKIQNLPAAMRANPGADVDLTFIR